jgi:tetratricopeptide (TPR) repeat protein
MTPDSLRKSVALFEEATRKDPSYARAYFALADAESELVGMTSEPALAGSERVRASLRKVLELEPNFPDAHGALAKIAYDSDWDWPHAEREFQLALDQGARSGTRASYGWALTTRGRFSDAQIQCQAAEGLDPLGIGPRTCQFWIYYFQHKYPEAKRVLTALLDMNPDSLYAHALLGLIAAIQHDCGESQAQFGTIAAKYTLPVTKIGLAYASACAGDATRAREDLREAEAMKGFGYTSPYQLALGYAFLNDKQEAIRYLRKSAADHEGQIHYLKYDPVFDGIRSDPQFRELEKMVGLE